ncbi:MAG TPA: PP2C family serine/threonine-protein phosphatase [Desulfosalsimonadaceae bacterium]|nr:PP2C family serine/threonine-protein phosphatase [Desulfosalsimonadaceae bacterium]
MKARVFSAMRLGPRNTQEDCLLAVQDVFQSDTIERQSEAEAESLIFAVCDGLGGHQSGDRASHFVCKQLKAKYQANAFQSKDIPIILRNIQNAARHQLPANSGTTLAGLFASHEMIHVFNTGDSRVYKLDNTAARYISHDHSVVQELIDNYLILQQTARNHPYRNLVEFGIGPLFVDSWENHAVFVHSEAYQPPATFLICSDGLSDQMTEAEIHRILMPTPVSSGRTLLSKVSEKGLVDNTSFIIVQFL